VLGAVIVYVIVGLAHALGRLPTLGRALPLQLRYLFSIAAIGLVGFLFAYLVMANKERALALAPQYQQSLLAAIQRMAVYFASRPSPPGRPCARTCWRRSTCSGCSARCWRRRLDRRDLRRRAAVRHLPAARAASLRRQVASLSDDPARVARIRQVIEAINRRIGSYLALKTLLSVLLGVASYAVMRFFGLEFAALWACWPGS